MQVVCPPFKTDFMQQGGVLPILEGAGPGRKSYEQC